MQIPIKKLSPSATIPEKTPGNAGYDLFATSDAVIVPGKRLLLKTNISMAIPDGYYGRIAPRSGMAFKNGMDVLAGVIDSTYRGDIGVILLNTDTNAPYHVLAGDRIAQIIIEKYHDVDFEEVATLDETGRGEGFGSSGR